MHSASSRRPPTSSPEVFAPDSCLSSLGRVLSFGPNVDKADKDGRTPLMSAIERGLLEAAQMLLGEKPSINAQDSEKRTASSLGC